MKISDLQPKEVWYFFEQILSIPRCSKKEEKIIEYLKNFAVQHNLEYKIDKAGNILITKKATKGFENKKTIVLQSHVDMVCEKNSDCLHNFDTDPIQAYIDGDWIKAKGTTLGADNGIGVAIQLAILAAHDISHGPIECLFTVDEETGLTGASKLKEGFFNGKILINLDSEDEGEIFIGCAGGIDTTAILKFDFRRAPKKIKPLKVTVTGLHGGHSGDDIHKGFANAIKVLTRILYLLDESFSIKLAYIEGGNLRNAIPREAFAVFYVTHEKVNKVKEFTNKLALAIKEEFAITEPEMVINISETDRYEKIIDDRTKKRLIYALHACDNGVIEWSKEIPNLVETSSNLASIRINKRKIVIQTSQRSAIDSAKKFAANSIASVFKLARARVSHSDGYPGWKPNVNSEILNIAKDVYKKMFNSEPKVKAIHAGLECGLFLEKYPYLDMISVGPTIKNVHSPNEQLSISSTIKFWNFLTELLKAIPDEN
ncbi:MAG: aminoacyl-histidine dipeptidase [Bacteroidales bacterium]|nr:aminoacyl-histidine dipeptidase [Bacteroidales bacterium]